VKKIILAGLLSGILSAESYNLYSYFNSHIGTVQIDTTKNSEDLEIKLEIPLIPDNFYKAGIIDFSIKKKFGFHKINDSTYIEILQDEAFTYLFSNSSWNLTSYKGNREEKKILVGTSYESNTLVDVIRTELTGTHKRKFEIFIGGLKYLIELPEFSEKKWF